MAWNEPGGNKPDPWGGGNRGGGGDGGPPDLDEVLRKIQRKVKRFLGGGAGGSSGGSGGSGSSGINGAIVGLVLVVALAVYFIAGIEIVSERERGVVLRFGVYDRTLGPGFNWAPPLVDRVSTVNVTNVRLHRISSSSMLTGDLNIVEVDLSVQYSIGDSEDFVLNVRQPESSLQQASDSALRHVVGTNEMHDVLTEGRSEVAMEVEARLQEYLDSYASGILVEKVNVEETKPPEQVQDAFDDVNRAREDEERVKNEAQAYVNRVIPEARGSAQRMLEEARGYREQVVSRAQGDAQRFERLLAEYEQAPEVTRERLYIDTVQEVMSSSSKVLVDVEGGNNLLYLPLEQLMKQVPSTNPEQDMQDMQDMASDVEQRVLDTLRQERESNSRRREVR